MEIQLKVKKFYIIFDVLHDRSLDFLAFLDVKDRNESEKKL
jgi:hypothetical protein